MQEKQKNRVVVLENNGRTMGREPFARYVELNAEGEPLRVDIPRSWMSPTFRAKGEGGAYPLRIRISLEQDAGTGWSA